jgi:sRNA-binding protein
VAYLETLKAGAARIDLEGNPVGAVTAADEEDAKRKIAKLARRAAAKASEGGKAAGPPSAAEARVMMRMGLKEVRTDVRMSERSAISTSYVAGLNP